MLPHRITNGAADVLLQSPLRQQAGQITRKGVARAALAEERVAGGIYGKASLSAAN